MSKKNFVSYGDAETLLAELEVKLEEKANASDLGTAAAKDVPSSGNASTTQVVMGNDTRLSDSRNAKDVYAWAKAATKPSYTASEVGAIATTAKGTNGGVAELDSNGKVPSSQLPSFVDDVIEGYYKAADDRFYKESTFTTLITPEDGKSWVDIPSSKSYRWTGSTYVRVDEGVQLGETSSTAYRGDRGKTAYDHSQLTSGNPHNVTKSNVGLGNVPNVSTNNQTPTFTQASSRANIASGEKLSVILGKVMKFFADIKDLAFIAKDGSSSTKYLRGDGTWQSFSSSTVGLGNVTNNKQIAGLASGTTENHVVTFGSDGYSVKDSGFTIGKSVPSDAKFTDTTYSEMSLAELKTGTATSLRTLKASVLNPAIKMYCPHYATCTSQAANQKKTVVVADANFQLYTGCIIAVKFDANNTYSATADAPVMFNVNSTGDKEVRGNSVNAATTGTAINIFGVGNRIISYQYDGTYWVKIGQSWDDNTKYSPQSLGFGYGTCGTAAATAAKAVTLSGYALVNNGIVSVKFTYDVPASATMNINDKGAKSIYYHGAAITAGIIKAGDIATFIYISNIYHLISIDSQRAENCVFDPTGTELESTDVEAAIKELESNFQDGVDAVYDAVVAKGSTPESHSLSDVVDGIAAIQTTPPTQTKSCTPSTSAQTITPDSGYLLSSVSVGAISTQEKSCTPSTSAQTITPDSGKYLTKVSVSAISTQEKSCTPSTSAQTITPDSGKYLTKVSVSAISTQTKTVTASRSAQNVTPDSGKYLSKVTINKYPDASGTYTYPSGSTGGTVDMGATNNLRYVNASNVYAKGKADGDVKHTVTIESTGPKTVGIKVYKDGTQIDWSMYSDGQSRSFTI